MEGAVTTAMLPHRPGVATSQVVAAAASLPTSGRWAITHQSRQVLNRQVSKGMLPVYNELG